MVQFQAGEALTSPLFRVEHIVKRWQFWLGLVVSAVFLGLALRGLKLDEVMTDLRTANYLWLLPGVAVRRKTWSARLLFSMTMSRRC